MHVIDEETRRFGRLLHYAGVLVTVVCASAGYSFLHAPAVRTVADTSAQIDELMLSVQNAPLIRTQHDIDSAKLHEVTTRIANVQRRVPQDADAGEFLKQVTQLAGNEKLAINDFHPEKPETRNGYAEMQVTLKGAGSFGSICAFVDRLNKLARLSKIKNLTLSAGDNATEYPMTATLEIYFGLRANDTESGQEGAVADAQKESQRGGMTRGKAALIGVLTVVLLGVLYLQYGRSSAASNSEPVASAARRRPAEAPAKQPPTTATVNNTQNESGSPVAVAAAVDETRWKSPNLADVVDYDPFALPATFPKPPVIDPTSASGQGLVAAAAADDAKSLAEAIAQMQKQLEELKQRGVHVIVRERDQYVAMIGDRTVHVGDEIDGFTVTEIDPAGVRVERKVAQ